MRHLFCALLLALLPVSVCAQESEGMTSEALLRSRDAVSGVGPAIQQKGTTSFLNTAGDANAFNADLRQRAGTARDPQPLLERRTASHAADEFFLSAAAKASLSRHVTTGGLIGGAVGAGLAIAVVSMADCLGDKCTGEAAVGIIGYSLAGALVGGAIGGLVYAVRP